MQNSRRLIKKVAEKTKIPVNKVEQVIKINHLLLRETMENKTVKKTFYLRKVGFFTWWKTVTSHLENKIKQQKQ